MTHATSSNPDFNASSDASVFSFGQIRHHWDSFSVLFNSTHKPGVFNKFLRVEQEGKTLTLAVVDVAISMKNKKPFLNLAIKIRESKDKSQYEMTCNLDPHGFKTKLPVHTFNKTSEDMQKLLNRCLAEILAAVGPEQGAVFRELHEQYKHDPTVFGGPVVN